MRRTLLVVAALVTIAAPAWASPEDVAAEVASEMTSPFCEGVTLHDCPSAAADRLRLRIEGWAAAGWSEERIWDELESEFGPNIHAVPPTEGSGLLAWILPGAAVAAGVAAAALVARNWSRRGESVRQGFAPGTPSPPIGAEDRKRLDAELNRLREET